MLDLNFPVLFFAIAMIPNVAFLLAIYRFCKRREVNSLPWMSFALFAPFISIPSLFARFQPEEKQQQVFWKLFIMMLILNALFLFVAFVVDRSGAIQLF
jgi:hypothetical protein